MRLATVNMKCIRCGTEIPEGYDICADCADAEATAATVDPYFAQPSFPCEQAPQTGKKSKKKGLIAAIAGVIAVLMAAFVFLNFATVKAMCIKNFGTGEEYFTYVVQEDMNLKLSKLSNSYGKLYARSQNMTKTRNNKIELNLSDEALKLLENALPAELNGLDLKNYKNINLTTETFPDSNNQQIGLLLALGEKELLNIRAIADMEGKDIYLGLLNLTDSYLRIDDVLEELTELTENVNISAINAGVTELLPTEELMNKLLNKYCGLIIEAVGEMEKDSADFTVGEYTQKLTVLTYAPTEAELSNIAKTLLTELKADEDIKTILTNIDRFLASNINDSSYEEGELYGKFTESLTEALKESEESTAGENIAFTMTFYIDSKHDLAGISVEDNEEKQVSYMKLKDGENFVFEAKVPDEELEITGKGVNHNDVINAEYAIVKEGSKLADLYVEELKKYSHEGSIQIVPSADLLSELGGKVGTFASLLDPSLKIDFNIGVTSTMITCSVLNKDTEFATVTVNGNVGEAQKIMIPSDKAMPVEEIKEWANTISLDKLMQIVDNLALPEEYVQTVESIVDMAKQLGGIGNLLTSIIGF